jgi:hypothetical protein
MNLVWIVLILSVWKASELVYELLGWIMFRYKIVTARMIQSTGREIKLFNDSTQVTYTAIMMLSLFCLYAYVSRQLQPTNNNRNNLQNPSVNTNQTNLNPLSLHRMTSTGRMMKGQVQLITGPMHSGKTTALLRRRDLGIRFSCLLSFHNQCDLYE